MGGHSGTPDGTAWPNGPIRPIPAPSPRPWGGGRLGGDGTPIGELWLAGPDSIVSSPWGSVTLDDLAARAGPRFIGQRAAARLGDRFPLLAKVIDAADWLSLQVHPDDRGAMARHGDRALGKAEAWLVLDADAGSSLVIGPAPDLGPEELRAAIAAGDLGRDRCSVVDAIPGDTWLLEPGTLHAIGAGCFVFEVEQPSDLTYRISDWGRPPSPGRRLHTTEALETVRPASIAQRVGRGYRLDGQALVTPWFRLEVVDPASTVERRPGGESLEVITAIAGRTVVRGPDWEEPIAPFTTLVVPASVMAYELVGEPGARVAIGSIW